MYMHTLARFCESRRRFSLFSPLNIYISLFFCLLPACCRVPLLHSPGARPSVSLSPPSLPAFPLLVLRSSCLLCVPWLPCVVWCVPFRLPVPVACSVLPSVCSSRRARPWSSPAACRLVSSVWLSSGGGRYSSAIRRKTLWQWGQMQRVYVPGLVSSCLCAAVCSVARSVSCPVASVRPSVACPACCRVSSGGSNRRYASISRAFAMRCSVCNVMLLLSICIRTFCRVSPKRLDSSTTPTPAAFMCSRM